MSKTTNKFAQALSASDKSIKETRANMLADTTVLEVEAKISNVKRDLNTLKNKMNQLTDLAPDNTYSLRPGHKDFNAAKWMEELCQVKLDIRLKTIELEVAESIQKEWFGEEISV